MAKQPLLATVTGEFFQPVRLHYQVLDRDRLLGAFKNLRCVDADPKHQRWVWLYDYEAKGLRFKQSYAQLPQHLHPIVIGSIFLRTQGEMLLDLRSCERAKLAIEFFDKHLPRSVAKVTDAEVVNKLFGVEGNQKLTPDGLFDRQERTCRDPEDTVRRIKEVAALKQSPEEKFEAVWEDVQAKTKQPLPEIERFPIHFYEDGIQGFSNTLQLRQLVAMQHWLGKSEYTMFDALQSIVKRM